MGFGKRAVCHLMRKKPKTIILFLVLLITESMILCTGTILRASEESISALKEKTKSKIVAEIVNEKDLITESDLRKIKSLEQVKEVNREAKIKVYPSGFQVLSNSQSTDPENQQMQLIAYDDLGLDGAFADEQVRLIEGTLPEKDNEVVINQFLVTQNQWEIGDTITFQTNSGISMQAIISGYYLSGTERNQAKEMSAVYRIENTMYGKPELITQIQDISGYESVSVYLKDPESMEAVGQSITGILGDKAELTKSDTLFQQMKQPLEQAIRIVQLMQYLTIGTGMIVVTLLLCMWMRSRKKEVAVYISLGERKSSIFMQMMLESLLVFVASTLFAVVAGNFLAKWLKTILFAGENSMETLQINIQSADIGLLVAVGGGILLLAVGISLIPVLGKNPKDTLSEMEG